MATANCVSDDNFTQLRQYIEELKREGNNNIPEFIDIENLSSRAAIISHLNSSQDMSDEESEFFKFILNSHEFVGSSCNISLDQFIEMLNLALDIIQRARDVDGVNICYYGNKNNISVQFGEINDGTLEYKFKWHFVFEKEKQYLTNGDNVKRKNDTVNGSLKPQTLTNNVLRSINNYQRIRQEFDQARIKLLSWTKNKDKNLSALFDKIYTFNEKAGSCVIGVNERNDGNIIIRNNLLEEDMIILSNDNNLKSRIERACKLIDDFSNMQTNLSSVSSTASTQNRCTLS